MGMTNNGVKIFLQIAVDGLNISPQTGAQPGIIFYQAEGVFIINQPALINQALAGKSFQDGLDAKSK